MLPLAVDSLTRRYGRHVAVDGVSFEVERGAVHGLLGPNGSGKTTTLACCLGLLAPHAGEVTVLGQPARRLDRTRGRVGVVFDRPTAMRGQSVRGQVRYSARLLGHRGGRRVNEALELVGLGHLARRPARGLSLGQQKRMALASALLGEPEFLVLDEPLSGLDPMGVRGLLRLISELSRRGLTILLSSHRLHEIEPILSHASILIGGRLVESGSLDALLGGQRRLRLVTDGAAPVEQVVARLGGSATRLGEADHAWVVELEADDPAGLNRALHEAGVGVRELTAATPGLPDLFDSLLDDHASGPLPFQLA
jgi:ABC-2 type transport system ATP-binding protein